MTGAWETASPEQAVAARESGTAAALRRYGLTADENLVTATELLGKAARNAPVGGRPLYAGLLSVPWPNEPIAAFWHAATLLREQRGDAHVAALLAAGISGRESNVLHAASGGVSRDEITVTSEYDEAEWQANADALASRGLLEPDGSLTTDGRAIKDDIEHRTDAAALGALDALSDTEIDRLFTTLTPITRHVVADGDLPDRLQHKYLGDDGARLS